MARLQRAGDGEDRPFDDEARVAVEDHQFAPQPVHELGPPADLAEKPRAVRRQPLELRARQDQREGARRRRGRTGISGRPSRRRRLCHGAARGMPADIPYNPRKRGAARDRCGQRTSDDMTIAPSRRLP